MGAVCAACEVQHNPASEDLSGVDAFLLRQEPAVPKQSTDEVLASELDLEKESKPAPCNSRQLSNVSTADASPKDLTGLDESVHQVTTASEPATDEGTDAKADRLEAWRLKLAQVEQLVDQLRNYEAGLLLRDLDHDVQQANRHELSGDELKFCQQLQGEMPVLTSLRSFMGRLEKGIAEIAVPSQRTDVVWSEIRVEDSSISKDFVMDIKVRYKNANEYVPNGGRSQFSARAEVQNLPMSLVRRIALEREADLAIAPPSAIIDKSEGKVRGRDGLFCSYFHLISKLAMIPWKTDNVDVREFSKLKDALLPGLRPNMFLMMATPALADDSELAGFKVPPCQEGCTRAGLQFLRFVEPEDEPGRCRLTILVQASVNIPSWLLPIYFVKQIVAKFVQGSFRNLTDVVQRWAQLGYEERIERSPEFYNAVQKVE